MFVNFGDELSGSPSTQAMVGGKYNIAFKGDMYMKAHSCNGACYNSTASGDFFFMNQIYELPSG